MIEILADDLSVLNCLVHAESIKMVQAETGLSAKVVLDIIRTLWHHRYIKAVDANEKEVLMVDVDLLKKARFRLTAKGFEELERH